MVGVTGLELATSCTPSKHSSQLSYTPTPLQFYHMFSFCQFKLLTNIFSLENINKFAEFFAAIEKIV